MVQDSWQVVRLNFLQPINSLRLQQHVVLEHIDGVVHKATTLSCTSWLIVCHFVGFRCLIRVYNLCVLPLQLYRHCQGGGPKSGIRWKFQLVFQLLDMVKMSTVFGQGKNGSTQFQYCVDECQIQICKIE
jgi:hypothetical protein